MEDGDVPKVPFAIIRLPTGTALLGELDDDANETIISDKDTKRQPGVTDVCPMKDLPLKLVTASSASYIGLSARRKKRGKNQGCAGPLRFQTRRNQILLRVC